MIFGRFLLTCLPFAFFSLFSPDAQAAECGSGFEKMSAFSFAHELPPAIPPSPGKEAVLEAVLDPTVLSRLVSKVDLTAGGLEKPLNQLEDGYYVYLISKRGTFAFMERSAVGADGKLLSEERMIGTHEGLSIALDRPEVVAAGEFVVRGGRANMLSNGSGTYRGGKEHLGFATRALSQAGLHVDGNTVFFEYSTKQIPNPHSTVLKQVQREIEVRSSPALSSLRRDVRSVMAQVANNPWQTFLTIKPLFKTERGETAMDASQLISQWKAPLEADGDILIRFLNRVPEERMRRALQLLRESAPKE